MIYLVLSSLCLALLYGVYRVAMSRTTLHRFNRVMLLSILVLSAILPAIRISAIGAIGATGAIGDSPLLHVQNSVREDAFSGSKGDSPQLPADYNEEVLFEYEPAEEIVVESAKQNRPQLYAGVKVAETVTQLDWVSIITYLYLMGVAFFMIRLLIGIIRAETLCRLGGRSLADGSRLLVCDGEFQPTSWHRTVIMSRRDYESTEKDIIIEHELTHIHFHHSIDVVIAQLTCALQWFNPAVWALKRSLQEVHEYEADANVLADGENERRYQICLVQAALGSRIGYVTSNFADCSTKKRIKMMKRSQSSPFACLRALFMLPVVLVTILLASACKPKTSQDASVATSDSIVEEPVVKPEPYDTLAFLENFGYGGKGSEIQDILIKQLNNFITIEADGSIWFNIAGQNKYERAYLSSLDRDFEQAKSKNTIEVANPDMVYVMYNRDNHMDICAEVIRQLQNSYADDKIVLAREPFIRVVPPPPGLTIDVDKDDYMIVMINVNNQIRLEGQWHSDEGVKVKFKSNGEINPLEIETLDAFIRKAIPEIDERDPSESKIIKGLKVSFQYDLTCSSRVRNEVDKILCRYVESPYLLYQRPVEKAENLIRR